MKKYRLLLFPDVFLWCKGKKGMFYHTKTGKIFVFDNTGFLQSITEKLLIPENLYTVFLNEEERQALKEWIEEILKSEFGKLTDVSSVEDRSVSYMPLLNLQMDVERLKNISGRSIGENILSYLHEIVFYVGGKLETPTDFYKQFPYPMDSDVLLPSKKIIHFLEQTRNSGLHSLYFLGGNLSHYPEWEKLLKVLDTYEVNQYFYVWDKEFLAAPQKMESLFTGKNRRVKIIFTSFDFLEKVVGVICSRKIPATLFLPVCSEEEYEGINKILEKKQGIEWELKPLFKENNINFFEKYVFTTSQDFENLKLTRREIFAHQALNTYFFGKLTVMPDGKMYSSVHLPALGNIEDSLYEVLYREMSGKNAWRNIRNQLPCKNCLYQWLCPSPSDYEKVIGKYNLCHLLSDISLERV